MQLLSQKTTQSTKNNKEDSQLILNKDKNNPLPDSLKNNTDSSSNKIQKIDSLHLSKDSLDAPVDYSASDSGVLDIPAKEFILYGKANVKYTNLQLDASIIRYNSELRNVKAYGTIDTSKNPLNKPTMTQGEMKSVSDSIEVNLNNMKARTKGTFYNEGEIYVHAQILKKVSPTEYYAYRARFTTCNLDTPHFAIRARRLKLITNKLAVSGPASPEFEGVPLPIGIPFGIYPLARGRHSGLMAPTFVTSEDFGVGLEGLGYYKVFSQNWDMITRTNFYSYGGWSVNFNPKYYKRYHYQGSFNITLQNTKSLDKSANTYQEYNVTKSYSLNWFHNQDTRARPNTSFGANVNFASTRYNSTVLNNPYLNYQNQLNSSISYSKNFGGKANININANHNQNNNTHLVNLNLPSIGANIVTLYPFQRKDMIGTPKWYEKLGIGYSGSLSNQIAFYDTAFVFKKLLDTIQWGATHNIPISISLPAIGPVTISPSVSYEERWYGQKVRRTWDGTKVDTFITKGLYRANQMTFGIGTSTRIFGTYLFKNKYGLQAIRHEVRPSISFSYKPDLVSHNFYSLQVDTLGHFIRYSQFDGVIPGAYAEGNSGSVGFTLDNLLEMKVKSHKDTTNGGIKKVKLLDGFGFSTAYNLLADSFALSPLSFYARSTLFNNVSVTGGFILDPYDIDSYGYRKKNLLWYKEKFSAGRITSGNIALSGSLKSKAKDGKDKKESNIPIDPYQTPEEQQRTLQYTRANPAEYTDFDIPWSLSWSYSLNFYQQLGTNYVYTTKSTSSLNFNGDFSLTPKWKIGGTGYYNLNLGALQQLSMFISREMHCWQMSINITPLGLYKSFTIMISPKSGILRDLKINRSRTFSNY